MSVLSGKVLMINERLTEEELESLFKVVKSHSEILTESGPGPEVIELAQIVRALSELQQRRKAEVDSKPVAYTTEFYMKELDKSGVYLCWLSRHAKKTENSVRLYANPQPTSAVPGEITLEQVAEMTAARGAEYSIRDSIIATKWWNACRTAMLQTENGPLTNEETRLAGSSQVPTGRWIPVSERMPEAGVIVMTASGGCVNAALVERTGTNHLIFHVSYNRVEIVSHSLDANANPATGDIKMNRAELLKKISTLASECHALACELDIGDERTEVFELYEVLRKISRRGASGEMLVATNPHLSPGIADDSEWINFDCEGDN